MIQYLRGIINISIYTERRFIMRRKFILKRGPIKGILRVERSVLEQKAIIVKNDDDDYDSSNWWTDECGLTE